MVLDELERRDDKCAIGRLDLALDRHEPLDLLLESTSLMLRIRDEKVRLFLGSLYERLCRSLRLGQSSIGLSLARENPLARERLVLPKTGLALQCFDPCAQIPAFLPNALIARGDAFQERVNLAICICPKVAFELLVLDLNWGEEGLAHVGSP